jgi:plastocyanin
MKVSRLPALVLMFAALSCGGGGSTGPGDDDDDDDGDPGTKTLGSISTNVTSMNLTAGQTGTIEVTAFDTDNQVISNPGTPTFTSAVATIAEVSGAGDVLGLSAGSTQITVRLTMGSVSKTATVAVAVTGALPNDVSVVASSGDYTFTPATVAVSQGGTVNWSFGTLEHTVTFAAVSGAPTNINSGYGGTISRTFQTRGDFSYVCTLHAGMQGKVIVR